MSCWQPSWDWNHKQKKLQAEERQGLDSEVFIFTEEVYKSSCSSVVSNRESQLASYQTVQDIHLSSLFIFLVYIWQPSLVFGRLIRFSSGPYSQFAWCRILGCKRPKQQFLNKARGQGPKGYGLVSSSPNIQASIVVQSQFVTVLL